MEYFLKRVAPSKESEDRRESTFTKIKAVIENALGKISDVKLSAGGPQEVAVLRYGSDPLKTYLPESDVDITVIIKETAKASG